ncbi:hypothetical protein ALI22I_27380 [Saccharothrix sp. ALI-22-I]|uniref:hypothetical protein n=1 Tax=Saccharothrix sp. ALI-22-I TaxID=1933778 RepID=UPI00097BDEBB|nr:hypothetical protein [Saccharothrix sp. ALI-22-I]ONI85523.1 hypothetical protein ALI22I_27380 [Saccharothrix sp. ALI-22-I]
MKQIRARRVGALTAALVLGLVVAPPAWAANPAGVASVGSAEFGKAGKQVSVPPLAPCAVDGTTSNKAEPVVRPGVRFGAGTSSCTTTVVDPANSTTTTTSEATGTDFELSALIPAGGPRLRVARWKVTCTATESGTNAGLSLGGIQGFPGLPEQLPANHVHEVKDPHGTLLATATFGETTLPTLNDGSIAMNLLHLRFTPASTLTGEVLLGTTACSPTP